MSPTTFIIFVAIFWSYHVITANDDIVVAGAANQNSDDEDNLVITKEMITQTDLPNAPVINIISDNYQAVVTYKDDFIKNHFYPADVFEVIKNVEFGEDCVVLCRMSERCRSFSFNFKLNKCYTFEVNDFAPNVKFFGELPNVLVTPMDLKNQKGLKRPTIMYSGRIPKRCGMPFPFEEIRQGNRRVKRILGGVQALPYSLPWMVQVIVNGRVCSGAIFNANYITATAEFRFVLTAASCVLRLENAILVLKAEKIYAVAGFHDVRFTQPFEQWNTIRRAFVPQNLTLVYNDIAILEAHNNFRFNEYVRPVCLPTAKDYLEGIVTPGQECFVAGWGVGKAEHDPNEPQVLKDMIYSPALKRANVHVLQHENDPDYYTVVAKTDQCNDGGIACEGDMGGPVFCKRFRPTLGPYYVVYGVVNHFVVNPFDLPSGHNTQPINTCASISKLRDWIMSVTRYATYSQYRPEAHIFELEPVDLTLL